MQLAFTYDLKEGISMQIGALIVAAGMSKRMGEFKPMLSIGSISVAQRVVATLSQAGVSKIVSPFPGKLHTSL